MEGGGEPDLVHIFDHANPKMRSLFLQVLQNASDSGVIDGCFLDRGNTNATLGAGGGGLRCVEGVISKTKTSQNERHSTYVRFLKSPHPRESVPCHVVDIAEQNVLASWPWDATW